MALSGSFYNYVYQQFGLYCEWSGVQDPIRNQTTVTLNVYVSYYTLNIGEKSGTITINGNDYSFTSPEIRDMSGGSHKRVLVATQSQTISHNNNGTASVSFSVTWNCTLTYHDTYYSAITASSTATLNTLDRTTPSITASINNITATSFTVTALSDYSVAWSYALDNGSWVSVSTSPSASVTFTVESLTPGTEYHIRVQGQRDYNALSGFTGNLSVSTIGGALLIAVSPIIADQSDAVLRYTCRVYDEGYTYSLVVSKDGDALVTISDIEMGISTLTRSIALTQLQRMMLMAAMPDEQETEMTFTLHSYDEDDEEVGTGSSVTGRVTVSAASAPIFNSFTYIDSSAASNTVTGDSSVIIQGQSRLRIGCGSATASSGTNIDKYRCTIGEKTVESTTTTIDYGAVAESGDVVVRVEAVDERGYSTAVTQTITVIPYNAITINSWSIKRVNNAEATIHIEFAGTRSSIMVNNVEKNGVSTAYYRYKLATASSYGSVTALNGITQSGTSFEYDGTPISLSEDNAYYVELTVGDAFTTSTIIGYINKGKPLMAFRSERVGINNNTPQSALDVDGEIRMNGFPVMGIQNTNLAATADLNDIKTQGLYFARTNQGTFANHYPVEDYGMLEVFAPASTMVYQRFTPRTSPASLFARTFINSSWSQWSSN